MIKTSIAAGLAIATVSFVALLGAKPSTDEICTHGYSKAHRMPYSESSAIKRQMIPSDHIASEYELDHIVPLCLGGSNNSSNLMLQPWDEARKKDKLEILACRAVCSGRLSIEGGRALFVNWKTSYKEVFGREP